MSNQFCVANLFLITSNTVKTLRGYSFYGAQGARQKDGTWSKDAYNTELTCKVEPAGEFCASWVDYSGEKHVIDLSSINIPEWLKETKAMGKALDPKSPGELYNTQARVVDGYAVKMIWNKAFAKALTKKQPLPEKVSDRWGIRFLVNEHKGLLLPNEEYTTDDGFI